MEFALYGYLMLGIAMFAGLFAVLLIEKANKRMERSGGKDLRVNIRVGKIASKLHADEKERQSAISRFADPTLDRMLQQNRLEEAREYASQRLHAAFAASNQDLIDLYRQYQERLQQT